MAAAAIPSGGEKPSSPGAQSFTSQETECTEGRKILITGATGLLGRPAMEIFRKNCWDVRGLCFTREGPGLVKCDLNSVDKITAQFDEFRPEIVLHLAAERQPDKLEDNPAYATRINVDVTRTVASLCAKHGAWLIFLSTNYVFDGKAAPYSESAKPNPLSVYGRSKYEGELVVTEVLPGGAILRVPLLYGDVQSLDETSVTKLLKTLMAEKPDALDNWQERYPTSTEDLAQVLEAFAASFITKSQLDPDAYAGVFHWQSNEMLTKYTMGLAMAEAAGLETKKLVPNNDPPGAGTAPRPQYERMLCSRLEKLLGVGSRRAAHEWRSNFKTSIAKNLQPFLQKKG